MLSRYELVYVIPTTFTDDEVSGIETKVGALFTKVGASIESTKRLGKFRLAYPIQDQRHGHYVMVLFTADTSVMAKLEEYLRITPEVLRHLILTAEDAGSDQKFELVQFAEVVVEGGKDDRTRRREKDVASKETAEKKDETVAVTEEKPAEKKEEKPAISAADIDAKIESALTADESKV